MLAVRATPQFGRSHKSPWHTAACLTPMALRTGRKMIAALGSKTSRASLLLLGAAGLVWTAVTCVCGVRLGIDTPTV